MKATPKLMIFWKDVEDGIGKFELIESYRKYFENLSMEELISFLRQSYKQDSVRHIPQVYEVKLIPTQTDIVDPNDAAIVYEGIGEDYKKFIVAVCIMLSLLNYSHEKTQFILKVARDMNSLNKEAGAKIKDDIGLEVWVNRKR